jgi:hypothetical protein
MPAAQSKAQQRGLDNHQLLAALRAFRRGDFSVRLPTDLSGLDGELAEAFNDAVNLNDQISKEFERLGDVVGKQGKINHRARLPGATGSWAASVEAVNNLITDMVHPTAEMARVIGATAKGDLSRPWTWRTRSAPARRVPAHRQGRQHHGGPAGLVRLGSDPRGPRSGHRRQAGRPGPGEGRGRHLEGPDRQRQPDGRQPDRPGAQHRRGDHRRRQRRPQPQDHRRREGRGAGAEEHHQHHGGPAQQLRLGSDPRGAGSGYGRQAGRPGQRQGRGRHLEGADRQRQPDGRQPDRPGPQHRRGDHRRGPRRPFAQDHRRREGRGAGAEEHHQHHGGPAQQLRLGSDPRGPRSRHRRQAGRPGPRGRRGRHLEGPHRQRQPDGRQPDRSGPQHRRGDHRRRHGRPQPRRSPST